MSPDSPLDEVFNLMREPGAIWMTVVNTTHFHAVTDGPDSQSLHLGKRDFGITAAIIIGIARATTAAVALTQTATTAETVNAIISKSAEALLAHEILNQHLYQAIHILQQQINLLAEELTLARDMSLLPCDPRFQSICLTPYQLHNTTEAWQQLAQYLEGTWSDNVLNHSVLLRENIDKLNVTRVSTLPRCRTLGESVGQY